MPAVTMRGRYLMREYWSDSDLFLRLTSDQREVYVGLWMLADDEGWLPRDISAISAAIYHYQDREPREKAVRNALERLRDLGKVVSHRCCIHLPAVQKYPRAGKKSTEHAQEHRRHSKPTARIQTDLNPSPDPTLRNPSLPDVAGTGARGGAPRSAFRDLVPMPPALSGGRR
jgi:hypothetical protein